MTEETHEQRLQREETEASIIFWLALKTDEEKLRAYLDERWRVAELERRLKNCEWDLDACRGRVERYVAEYGYFDDEGNDNG
jgi:hypothetical protein